MNLKKTILISGIKGFLASHLFSLLKDDFIVYGIGRKTELWNGIQVFSSTDLDAISIQPDFLILCHAAVSSGQVMLDEEQLFAVNVSLTEQLIKKFSSSKVIYISTCSVYDIKTNLIQEESPINPQSQYATSKYLAEQLVLETSNVSIIRLSSLYGIGMKENTIIPNYINQALKNKVITVWGRGLREQNYIYVEDACQYIILAVRNFDLVKNKTLLGVGNEEYSNIDLAQIIAEYTSASIEFVNVDSASSFHYNNQKTCNILGWKPETNFKAAIINYIQWKKEQF